MPIPTFDKILDPLLVIATKEPLTRQMATRAIRRISETFEKDHQRKALVVMATGAGKTRTVIALCDLLTYERQRDQLREQVMLAEIELNDAVLSHLDIDGVLAFAEHLLTNAARLWMELGLDQKQQLQQVLFPEGLCFDGEKFGTAVTCLAFKQLPPDESGNSGMASPAGFEPAFWP